MKLNPIVWFEICVQDMGRAKRFYEAVFQMQLEKPEASDIEMWDFPTEIDRGGASGALVKMEGVQSGGSGTIPYFHCDEVAVEASRIVESGGQRHTPKTSIGQHGFMVLAVDTEGNMVGLHMPLK